MQAQRGARAGAGAEAGSLGQAAWHGGRGCREGDVTVFSRVGAADADLAICRRASACLSWFGIVDLMACVTVTPWPTPSLG